jgi:hypothetical protein
MLPIITAANDCYSLFELYLHKLIFSYLFHDLTQALENAALAEKILESARSIRAAVSFHFYDSLARLAIFPKIPKPEQEQLLEKVAINQKKNGNMGASCSDEQSTQILSSGSRTCPCVRQ